MSDEITIQASLQVENGTYTQPKLGSGIHKFDQASAGGGVPGTVSVGTTAETISTGDLTTPGWVWMKNLDATNYVQWGMSDGGTLKTVGRLEAGEMALFRLDPGATLMMKANTAACLVQIAVQED
jgi:hypothetical protein